MRESISAQSCASVPPAPALMVRMQLFLSCGPLRKIFSSNASSSANNLLRSAVISASSLRLHRFRLGGGEFEHDLEILDLLAESRERLEFVADVVRLRR